MYRIVSYHSCSWLFIEAACRISNRRVNWY